MYSANNKALLIMQGSQRITKMYYTQGRHCLHSLNDLEQQVAITKIAAAIDNLPYLRRRIYFVFTDAYTAPSHVLASRFINRYIAGSLDSASLATLDTLLLLTI